MKNYDQKREKQKRKTCMHTKTYEETEKLNASERKGEKGREKKGVKVNERESE